MKRKVQIICDSTCDIGPDLIKEKNIEIIPLKVIFGDTIYRDLYDITLAQLYKEVEKLKSLPKTSAVSIGEFLDVFRDRLTDDTDLLVITISQLLSTTYQSAVIAAQEFPENRIHVIDSAHLSTGIGVLIMKACKMRDEGMEAAEIAKQLDEIKNRVSTSFVIEKMDYLYKGGRCGGLSYLFGTLLRIKPIIVMKEGKLIVGSKRVGNIKKVLDSMINEVIAIKDKIDKDYVFITHAIALESEQYIRQRLEKELDVKHLVTTTAGSVIASHCGAGTIGILYIVNE